MSNFFWIEKRSVSETYECGFVNLREGDAPAEPVAPSVLKLLIPLARQGALPSRQSHDCLTKLVLN